MRDKSLNIDENSKYDGCQHGPASMVCNIFEKKTSDSGIKNENVSNKE